MASTGAASGTAQPPEQGARPARGDQPARMQGGLEALTMRTLAEMLEVAPMALYRHVANKDDLIDAMVDIVFGEIGVPAGGGDWKAAMRRRAIALRDALARHRWAIGLMESRKTPGSGEPASPRRRDRQAPRRRLRRRRAAHAYSLLDSYIYGFALTKMNLPFDTSRARSRTWPRRCSSRSPSTSTPTSSSSSPSTS